MSGINLLYSSLSFIKNVYCGIVVLVTSSVKPVAHVFGLIMAPVDGNIPNSIDNFIACGFYYGCACGEGVNISTITCVYNYIGFMTLWNVYGITIQHAALHANCYAIASQQETIIYAAARSQLIINYFSLEPAAPLVHPEYWPSWVTFEDVLLDTSNYLYGEFSGDIKNVAGTHGIYPTRAHGGNNFLFKNIYHISDFCWVTADRPTAPSLGTRGYNMTTNKTEVWNASTWNDLF
jgi:hypothetical protein